MFHRGFSQSHHKIRDLKITILPYPTQSLYRRDLYFIYVDHLPSAPNTFVGIVVIIRRVDCLFDRTDFVTEIVVDALDFRNEGCDSLFPRGKSEFERKTVTYGLKEREL
jgi:hypothetical protein